MSEYTRIAAIADSFAASLELKTYRKRKMLYESMKELLTLGIYRYDPIYLKAFLDALSIYPIGSVVRMSDNSLGLVIDSVPGKPMRPMILILRSPNGEQFKSATFLHLLYQSDKYISSAVNPVDIGISLEDELDMMFEYL